MIYAKSCVTAPKYSMEIIDRISEKIEELSEHDRFYDIVSVNTIELKHSLLAIIIWKATEAEDEDA